MRIFLKKFGTVLVSRPSGKEAYLALQISLADLKPKESLDLDLEGVSVLTPSWADEFITPLKHKFKNRVNLLNTTNPSVQASLNTLEKAHSSQSNAS